ncbi:hypothetical protein CHU98_g2111 [Xylaria longipes]|nr:hypothetical protein CHU98_g2111 [Xylaria longipes]
MCRRIITHRMHHDVAAAMIMDPISPNPIVYANPLRTNFHRCELELPHPQRLLNSPFLKCSYHTCCVCDERAEYCDGSIAYLDSKGKEEDHQKPEECNSFILEHHHERLPYFGDEAAYPTAVPATWRGMVRIRGSNEDLFPGAAHRASWEEECFAECEKLYTLKNDTAILYDTEAGLRYVGFDIFQWVPKTRSLYDGERWAIELLHHPDLMLADIPGSTVRIETLNRATGQAEQPPREPTL